MKKKVLSAALAVCMIFGCASALPQDSFVDNISITSSAYEKEDLSWWEDVKYDVYDKKDGKERYRITGFSNQTAYSISLSDWYKDTIYSEKQFACIGEKAFNGYYHNLHSIEISPKYEVIEKDAFINSYNLTQFVIPKTVKSIGSHAIGYELDKGSYKKIGEFDKIKIICAKGSAAEKYAKDNGINYEINDDDFEYVLLDNGTYKIRDYYGDEKKLIEIPSFYRGKKVTVIEYGPDAEEVIIPDSITQIGKSAFKFSELLKKITIGKGVKEIGFETFSSCSNLKTVVFSEGLEEIGDYAFYCAGLTEINLPSTLKKIGSYSFGNCSDLKTVKLNNGIQYIGYAAFDQSGVETINFPKSITFIGGYAFFETPWLSNMQKKSSFVVVNGFLIDGKAAADAAGYIIQNDIKYVCDDAFNKSLGSINANTVRIKSGVETIGKRAFRECRNLKLLIIDDGLKDIQDEAFINCFSLMSVTIPSSVKTIGNKAFGYYETMDEYEKIDGFTICGAKGSAAEKYAKANGFKFDVFEPAVTRLAGAGRYETAAKISQAEFTQADTVVLANSMNYADALAGVPLAKAKNAPILLTNKETLDKATLAEIKRLKAKNVIILGGTGAISTDVENSLQKEGLKTERFAGETRYGTATAIAEKLSEKPTDIFFVFGGNYPDALSASAAAAAKNAPIIYLTKDGELNADTAKYLAKLKKAGSVKNAYVIGGTGVISDDMMKKAGNALGVAPTRLFGANRFETCIAVNEKFAGVLNGKMLCVATGMDFPDALAGGVYAAINKAPLFLVNGKLNTPKLTDDQKAYLKTKAASKITVFGGTGAVSDEFVKLIANAGV